MRTVLHFELMIELVCRYSHKHQERRRSMEHLIGLDVSVKETAVCIVVNWAKSAGR